MNTVLLDKSYCFCFLVSLWQRGPQRMLIRHELSLFCRLLYKDHSICNLMGIGSCHYISGSHIYIRIRCLEWHKHILTHQMLHVKHGKLIHCPQLCLYYISLPGWLPPMCRRFAQSLYGRTRRSYGSLLRSNMSRGKNIGHTMAHATFICLLECTLPSEIGDMWRYSRAL